MALPQDRQRAEVGAPAPPAPEFQPAPLALRVRGLRYRYPDGTPALDGVNLEIAPGEAVALIGPNGAGKSTLLLHLVGILHGEGEIEAFGLKPAGPELKMLRQKVGLLFEDPDDQLFMPRVRDDVGFGPRNLGLPPEEVNRRIEQALAATGMTGTEERAPHHLSSGQKKRVALAALLAMEPELLLLDEPTSTLDPRARRELIRVLEALPVAKLIATHDLELVLELCPRAVILDRGRVVADGPPAELLSNAALMEAHGLEVPGSLRPRQADA
ncbi:MAG TPA: ABC transporter ATP-binding protein [Armatimonadota bacterium]|nr:ABC transporter ATP-binding protein [Armatimonadota bacterium]HPT99579.1 ABC transporter ATP-binding protein [Armatimonadota bacterium]